VGSAVDIFRWRTGHIYLYRTWGRSVRALRYIQSCWLYLVKLILAHLVTHSLRVNKSPRRILCHFIDTGCLDDPWRLSQYFARLRSVLQSNGGSVAFPTVTERFFRLYRVETGSGAEADPLTSGIVALFCCGLKQPASEAGLSPLSCFEFQNTWIFTSTRHVLTWRSTWFISFFYLSAF
jgi:hypothetical protein